MWLYLVVIVAFIGALVLGFAGLGPFAFVAVLIAGAAIAARLVFGGKTSEQRTTEPTGGTMSSSGGRAAGGEAGPQDTADHGGKAHVETGAAHQGQRRMVPDEDHLPSA